MLSTFETWAEDTQHVIPALRAFLWWGIAVRAVLFFALGTLLIVRGNFLAEWLMSWQVVPVEAADVEEYTAFGYAALVLFLTAGTIARAATLRRLGRPSANTRPDRQDGRATESSGPTNPPAAESRHAPRPETESDHIAGEEGRDDVPP